MKSKNVCYLCGKSDLNTVRERLRYGIKRRVLECVNCGLIQLESKKKNLYEFYRSRDRRGYRKLYTPVLGREVKAAELFDLYFPFQKIRIDLFKPYLRKHFRVLEIGASAGHFLAALSPYVKERVGVELNTENARFMSENLGIRVFTEPIEKAKLPEKYFDAIFILQTLEHIDDPVGFLKAAKKFLKPRGIIFIEVPNTHDLEVLFNIKEFNDFYFREVHVSYFTDKTLKKIMNKAGFRGRVYCRQFANIFAHIRMNSCSKLMPNVTECWSKPEFRFNDSSGHYHREGGLRESFRLEKIKKSVNDWLYKADRDYRRILERSGVADCLYYIGRKK